MTEKDRIDLINRNDGEPADMWPSEAEHRSERIKMVKAMEFIVRNLNDEEIFASWLVTGVADGDIEYGDLSAEDPDDILDDYIRDEEFSDLMGLFLRLMKAARKSGGLYCDGVLDDIHAQKGAHNDNC